MKAKLSAMRYNFEYEGEHHTGIEYQLRAADEGLPNIGYAMRFSDEALNENKSGLSSARIACDILMDKMRATHGIKIELEDVGFPVDEEVTA